jgi:hypothetical protein
MDPGHVWKKGNNLLLFGGTQSVKKRKLLPLLKGYSKFENQIIF